MSNFISTDTAVLISFICQNIPNLFKYIIKYSMVGTREEIPEKPTVVLPKQIEEARSHTNGIMLHALNNVATVQDAINTNKDKLNELLKQRNMIENTLISLMSLDDQNQNEG